VTTAASSKRLFDNAGVDDTVELFVAGHGLHDDDDERTYYCLTHDADPNDLAGTCAPFDPIEGLLDGIPPRSKLFLMDTCESGEIDEELQAGYYGSAAEQGVAPRTTRGFSIKKAQAGRRLSEPMGMERYICNDFRRRTGAIVFSFSRGDEFSCEKAELENGIFTEEIVKALTSRRADADRDGIVAVDELTRGAELTVYEAVTSVLEDALEQRQSAPGADTGSAEPLFEAADALASAFHRVFGNDALLSVVERYRAFSAQELSRRTEAAGEMERGTADYRAGSRERAAGSLESALEAFRELGDEPSELEACKWTGNDYFKMGRLDQAAAARQRGFQLSKALSDARSQADQGRRIGIIYWYAADYAAALEHWQSSLAIYEKMEDRPVILDGYTPVAIARRCLAQFQQVCRVEPPAAWSTFPGPGRSTGRSATFRGRPTPGAERRRFSFPPAVPWKHSRASKTPCPFWRGILPRPRSPRTTAGFPKHTSSFGSGRCSTVWAIPRRPKSPCAGLRRSTAAWEPWAVRSR